MKQVTVQKDIIIQPEIKIKNNDKLKIHSIEISSIDKDYNIKFNLGKITVSKTYDNLTETQQGIFDEIETFLETLITSIVNS